MKLHYELTAGQMQIKMKECDYPILPNRQIVNFLQRYKKKLGKNGPMTEMELLEEVQKHPRDDNQPHKCYVTYENLGINKRTKKLEFTLLFTTPFLMKKQREQKFLSADFTFKVSWNDFPLMLTGFSDSNRKFHPTSITLTSSENSATYASVFRHLKFFDVNNPYVPDAVMGDGATSLTKAVNDTFGEDVNRFMCSWHLKKSILPKMKLFSKEVQDMILGDINQLKRAISEDEFTLVAGLMIESWRRAGVEDNFVDYFSAEWIERPLSKWYSGCTDFGTTNNGLEKKNCTIKDTVTLRKRLTIRQLFDKLISASEVFSLSPDYKIEDLKISIDDFKTAYDYKKKKPLVKVYDQGEKYFIQSSTFSGDFQEVVQRRRENSYNDWEQYVSDSNSCYFVRYSNAFTETLVCSCSVGIKKCICKHALVLACKLQYVKFPDAVTSYVIEGPRKAGRPRIVRGGNCLSRR